MAGSYNYDPSQGAPPPLSQLARLAGLAGGSGSQTVNPPSALSSVVANMTPVPPPRSSDEMDADSESDSGKPGSKQGSNQRGPRSRRDRNGPMTIEVPFEMVVACRRDGVEIHPGGYKISTRALGGKDNLLMKNLKSVVQNRRQVDPTIHPRPSIRFLVEPGGEETYDTARRQTLMSGLDWPVALQVSDSGILDLFATPREP